MEDPAKPTRGSKTRWLQIFAILLAIVCMYFALRDVDLREFARVLGRTDPVSMALAAIISLSSFVIRSLRWRLLAAGSSGLSYIVVFSATMIGYLCNFYLPARAGDFVRSAVLAREVDGSFGFVLGTTVTERLFDAILMAAMVAILIAAGGVLPDGVAAAAYSFAGLAVVGFAVILLGDRFAPLIAIVRERWLGASKLATWAVETALAFLDGARNLRSVPAFVTFFVLSIAAWAADCFAVMVVAGALALDLTLYQSLVLIVALALASVLPSTPGYLGVYQLITVSVLAQFSYARDEALALIVAYQLMLYAIVTLFGGMALWRGGGLVRVAR